jgi:hypothetical protein
MDRPTMKVSEPVRYRKRVQASTGTLNNMAAAHAIAPIRRIVFNDVSPKLQNDFDQLRLTIAPIPNVNN